MKSCELEGVLNPPLPKVLKVGGKRKDATDNHEQQLKPLTKSLATGSSRRRLAANV